MHCSIRYVDVEGKIKIFTHDLLTACDVMRGFLLKFGCSQKFIDFSEERKYLHAESPHVWCGVLASCVAIIRHVVLMIISCNGACCMHRMKRHK